MNTVELYLACGIAVDAFTNRFDRTIIDPEYIKLRVAARAAWLTFAALGPRK